MLRPLVPELNLSSLLYSSNKALAVTVFALFDQFYQEKNNLYPVLLTDKLKPVAIFLLINMFLYVIFKINNQKMSPNFVS